MLIYMFFINVLGFGIMWYDKIMAQTGKYKHRVAENRIFLIALAGGAIGVFIGMEMFKHKTKKLKFTLSMPLIIIAQIILIRNIF